MFKDPLHRGIRVVRRPHAGPAALVVERSGHAEFVATICAPGRTEDDQFV